MITINDFVQIVAGMTGAQLINALNGNSDITKQQFEAIVTALATLVIGNNIIQIKEDENGNFVYSKDGTNWSGVNSNVWGSITGSLNDQTDLKNALDTKASSTDLTNLGNTVSSLGTSITGLSTTVAANTTAIQGNTTAIGNLQTKQAKQVSSETIKYLRLSSSGFLQYSLDGTTWNNVQSIAEINWGGIGGEISNQADLQTALSSKANISALNAHINNTENPHSVTKTQVGLGNVDNTSDANKPISTATQEALDAIGVQITNLTNNKLQVSEDIQAIEYITLEEYNRQKQEGALSDTTIYFVD